MSNSVFGLLEKLVQINTSHLNFSEKQKCLDVIKQEIGDSLHIQEFEFQQFPSLLLSTKPSNHFDLLLAGHIDVVPGPELMFQVTEKYGKLFGRGVYDMKGSVAVMVKALQVYAEKKEKRKKKNVGLLLTSDEEIDGQNGTKAVLEETKLTADFALLPDNGDNWEIMLTERGLLHVRVKPQDKDTVLQALSSHFPQRGNENAEWLTTFSVENLDIRVRFTNPEDEQKALELLNQAEIVRHHKGAATSKENPNVKDLQQVMSEVIGKSVEFGQEYSTRESDAIYFSEHNIPVAMIRPPGAGEHTGEEWVSLKSLEDFEKVLKKFMEVL